MVYGIWGHEKLTLKLYIAFEARYGSAIMMCVMH